MTQAEQLVRAIRRKAMTWGEIEALRVSTCPWVRLAESGHRFLKPGEAIVRKVGRDGLVRIGIAKDQPCFFTQEGANDRKKAEARA